MKVKKDNFSAQSSGYARYRPKYPHALFDWIYTHCKQYQTAWDCATGNGQAAKVLLAKFDIVYATDISIRQLEKSRFAENIKYSVGSAEEPEFTDDSFDLVTVAQALHWFDYEQFFTSLKRVCKNGALFAAWGYNLIKVNKEIDPIIYDFYTNVVGAYWDEERRHVDNEYRNIALPFPTLPCPEFSISYDWTLEHLLGYFNTWSAVQHYIKEKSTNPVDELGERLAPYFNNEPVKVTFPIFMKACYIEK